MTPGRKGKAMKKNILLLMSLSVCLSCAPITTIEDIKNKRASGDYLGVSYNYSLEEVYDAIKFVWEHSEVFPISLIYAESNTDYAREQRAIWVKPKGEHSIDIAIFLETRGISRTYVQFIEGEHPEDYWRSIPSQYIIDESKFYLENGEQAYKKYTHQEQEALEKMLKGPR
jgi:hypothetical protein